MSTSVYSHLSELITVRDLATPLGPQLDVELASAMANEILHEASAVGGYDDTRRISLAKRGNAIVGWTAFDMLGHSSDPFQVDPISPEAMLAADTTALEVVNVFAATKWPFFFVLDNNHITGTLHFTDLFKLPFRLCLFALTLQIENSATDLIFENIHESWQALPEGRKEKAREIYQKRFGKPPDPEDRKCGADLLRSTMFCDKGTIIRKRKLAEGASTKAIGTFFQRAEKIRNWCAHTREEDEMVFERRELHSFIQDAHNWIELMSASKKMVR